MKIFNNHLRSIASIESFSIASLLLVLIYYNFYSNFRFLPITEGWFSSYATLVLNGKVPYRDFYLYLTPLYVWIIALIENIFGPSFFVLRIFGLFVVCGIALTLFNILKRIFTPSASFAGVTIAIIYYQSGNAHISYDFTQVLTLFAIVSIYFMILASDLINKKTKGLITITPQSCFIYIFLSGFFASCSFLVKQSNGSFIYIGVLFSFFFLSYIAKSSKEKLKYSFFFLSGSILPVLILVLYLVYENAFDQFINQIFFNAIEAKGTLNKILLNWIYGFFTPVLKNQLTEIGKYFIPIFVASHILFLIIKKYVPKKEKYSIKFNREFCVLILFFMLYITTIILAWTNASYFRESFFYFGKHLINYIIPCSIVWTIIIISSLVMHLLFSRTPKNPSTYILAIGTVGIIFGNGTSAGLSEISAFISLAWIISWLCNKNSLPYLGVTLALIVCLLLTTSLSYAKFDTPYSWWGVSEPDARKATFMVENKRLKNIYVSRESQLNFNQLISTLESSDGSTILSFPNIPMIYLLTERWPDSKAIITWFDFLNDFHAVEESERLISNPPDTIAYLELPEIAFKEHERLFRAGKPLGQRKILNIINYDCLSEHGYKIVLKSQLSAESMLYLCQKNKQFKSNAIVIK